MRYAIVSDLHANIEALTAVLGDIEGQRVERLVCLGDIVGYNASPNECVSKVRDLGMLSISGNHDRAAIGEKDPSNFGKAARRAIAWTETVLSEESIEFLSSLPYTLLVDGRFFIVHGALHPEPNDDLHLSNALRIEKSFHELASGRFGSNLCFFGHTHHPVAFECDASGGSDDGIRRFAPNRVEIVAGRHYLINPGSVGQPRDGDERAAYAIFDSESSVVEWRRVAYDVASNERRNREAELTVEPFIRRSLARIRTAIWF